LENNLKCGYSIVFLWNKKANAENADFNIIKKDMIKIFKNSKMMEI
jgi:hypothetical protein